MTPGDDNKWLPKVAIAILKAPSRMLRLTCANSYALEQGM